MNGSKHKRINHQKESLHINSLDWHSDTASTTHDIIFQV